MQSCRRGQSYRNADWCQAIRRRSGDAAPVGRGDGVSGARPSHSSQPFHPGSRVTRNLMVAGFLHVTFKILFGELPEVGEIGRFPR